MILLVAQMLSVMILPEDNSVKRSPKVRVEDGVDDWIKKAIEVSEPPDDASQ